MILSGFGLNLSSFGYHGRPFLEGFLDGLVSSKAPLHLGICRRLELLDQLKN